MLTKRQHDPKSQRVSPDIESQKMDDEFWFSHNYLAGRLVSASSAGRKFAIGGGEIIATVRTT